MKKQDLLSPASEASASSQESGRKTKDDGDLSYRVILVPIDFSEHSKRTIEYAVRFAARYNAHIRILYVFQIPDYAVTKYEHRHQGCEELINQVDRAEEEAQENLNALENQLLSKGVNAKAYLRVGYPFEEIVLMASDPEIDLVIIGSHGRTGIKRLLVGSTAERVVEHAPCPVLVVKERYLSP
jgi:universal stress protein A